MNSEEARKIIEDIRRGLGLDGIAEHGRAILPLLERLLAIVSDQLYNKSTRFLLELIQNADDNIYHCQTPTLNFTYKKGSLRIDCNESGFTEGNVRAICTANDSTKAGVDHSIGEKGIGFKSVFKVANVVFISSGNFSFKFDRSEKIGMIAPIWAEFPEKTIPGYTSFYMQLLRGHAETELAKDIRQLDPELLIFLRKLREINLTIMEGNEKAWSQKLCRTDSEENGLRSTTLHQGSLSYKYVVTKHHIDNLPDEPKRPKCSQSEIQLAFLVTDCKGSLSRAQNVHAFLPIRNYGFQFILQGDFLLTANREDIDNSSPWNCTIRDASIEAFVKAVESFNSGRLKYHWLQYLPVGRISEFFEPVKNEILKKLKEKPVLESCASHMTTPTLLAYVPRDEFADDNGMPFTLSSRTRSIYLSLKYQNWETGALSALGVKKLSPEGFLQDLEWMISNEPTEFRSKPNSWHSQLAKALVMLAKKYCLESALLDLEIVPLRGGQWVSVQGREVFFSGNARVFNIPNSVQTEIVDSNAEDDPNRYSLFKQLGVKTCKAIDICRRIVEMHSSPSFDPHKLTRDELLSHALFIFRESVKFRNDLDLWFITTQEEHCRGSELYVHGGLEENSPEATISGTLQTKYRFIHDDYIKAVSTEKDWLDRLCETFHLERLPRLATKLPNHSPDNFGLSEDFKFLFQECPWSDVLYILVNNWNHYSKWIEAPVSGEETAARRASRERIIDAIGSKKIKRQNDSFPLKTAFLPALDKAVDENSFVHILDIREPENRQWKVLRHFGVVVERNIHYYLRCLENIQGSNVSRKLVAHIYQRIQNEYSNNEQLIWNTFQHQSLIYTSCGSSSSDSDPNQTMRWLSRENCIRERLDIKAEYKNSANLFYCILAIGEGGIGRMIAEATLINRSFKRSEILKLFTQISEALKALSPEEAKQAVQPLKGKPLFPLVKSRSEAEFDALGVQGDNQSWFIADRHHLRNLFRGIVDLLAFGIKELESMKGLLEALDLNARRLSGLVKDGTSVEGEKVPDITYTRFLRGRAPFIISLNPRLDFQRDAISKQLRRVAVSSASRIVRCYVLESCGSSYISHPDRGEIASSVTTEELQIFMTKDDMMASHPPRELVRLIAEHCDVDAESRLLLFTILNHDISLNKLVHLFHELNIDVPEVYSEYEDFTDSEEQERKNAIPFRDHVDSNEKASLSDFMRVSEFGLRNGLPSIVPEDEIRRLRGLGHMSENAVTVKEIKTKTILYLGELMTSAHFQEHLKPVYAPEKHWTSPLRQRAGHVAFRGDTLTHSSFTMTDRQIRQKVTGFLVKHGLRVAESWEGSDPTYRFEVAVASGEENSAFFWTTGQFERMRKFRIKEKSKEVPKNVVILVRICNIFSDPVFDLYVDPWRLVISDKIVFDSDWWISASIDDKASPLLDYRLHIDPWTKAQPPKPISVGEALINTWKFATMLGGEAITRLDPSPRYSYKQLTNGHIRLISLLPGDYNASLRGLVYTVPLQDAGTYWALSYTWGDPVLTHWIQTLEGSIRLTASLYSALKHLRNKDQPIVLWVDAICINQDNKGEKSHQIRLLPSIFRGAACVLAYLGHDNESDSAYSALEALMQITANETLNDTKHSWPHNLPKIPSTWNGKGIPPTNHPIWLAISKLFERPWFRRVWIIQEVVFATRVRIVCGKLSVDWNRFFHAVEVIYRELKAHSDGITFIQLKWAPFLTMARHREDEAKKHRPTLIQLLESYRYAKATLDCDRLFSLVNLAEDGDNPSFEPDYEAPFEVIVQRFACAFVKQGRAMQLLYQAGINSKPRQFPSWIPDWTVIKQDSLCSLSGQGIEYAASGSTKPRFKCKPSSGELEVYGFRVDVIKSVTKAKNVPEELKSYFEEIDSILTSLPQERRARLKWEVPIAGVRHPKRPATPNLDMKSSYEALRECQKLGIEQGTPETNHSRLSRSGTNGGSMANKDGTSLWTRSQNYRLALEESLSGWRFFITKKGYPGVAPPGAQPGDTVNIFYSGVVPFLTRESEERKSAYRLVGQCYVDGMMHGQVLNISGVLEAWIRLY